MSDFTHTIDVVATLDNGAVIRITNSYVIPDVLHFYRSAGGVGSGNPSPIGDTPSSEPVDFALVAGRGNAADVEIEDGGDNFTLRLKRGDAFPIFGPFSFEFDNTAAGTNAGAFTKLGFTGTHDAIVLNNTAS